MKKNLIFIIILLVIMGCDVKEKPLQDIDNNEVKQDIDSATDETIVMEDNNKEQKETGDEAINTEITINEKNLIVNGFVIGTYSEGIYLNANDSYKDFNLLNQYFDVLQGLNVYNKAKVNDVSYNFNNLKYYWVTFDIEEPEFKRSSNFFAISSGDEKLLGDFNNIYEYQKYHEAIGKMINEQGIFNTPVMIDTMKSLDIDGDGELETLVHATNRAIGNDAKLFYSDDEIARNVSEEDLMFTELIGVYDILAIFDGSEYYIVSEKYQRLNEYEIRKFDTTVYNYENLPDENINLFEPNHYTNIYLYSSDGGSTAYNLNIVLYNDFSILVRDTEYFLNLYDIDEDGTYEIITYTDSGTLAELPANYSVYKYTEGNLHKVINYIRP